MIESHYAASSASNVFFFQGQLHTKQKKKPVHVNTLKNVAGYSICFLHAVLEFVGMGSSLSRVANAKQDGRHWTRLQIYILENPSINLH